MRQPNTNPDRLKYKVYRVVNIKTGKVSRLEWAGKIKGGDTMRYERIL